MAILFGSEKLLPAGGGDEQQQMSNRRNYEQQGHSSQSQGVSNVEADISTSQLSQQTGTIRACSRAKWSHQMKLFLIQQLKDHDVPGFRTHNAWSKDAWTSIVSQLNCKFGVSLTVNQVKQKEQDLKKDYRSVKDLVTESGFGWDNERMMVDAPDSVWDTFAARKKSKDALQWRDKSFPYYDELAALYDGRYAEGRTRRGMDYYASKAHNAFISVDEKKEEIDRFAAIEEKKLEDPYSINKCITALEGLDGLQTSDILMASDIFQSKDNREIFLSYSSDALRLAWITREIARTNPNYQL
ncbi:L10-interacting MYB domain-containing protein-like [Oryza glaberrima]|uniref:L10-interacting MYB domain-containing protein-like n=1 Tax=Oryza glaberrima TaxID=4538 RepID=UPI00224C1EDF|nr:L10-interacting MYB domain-containing protein-like [Oryza glaberrima]